MRGPRSRPSYGWAALTPAERAVAREIAAGHTNAQAARSHLLQRGLPEPANLNTLAGRLRAEQAKVPAASRHVIPWGPG